MSSIAKLCRHLKHFKAMITPQTFLAMPTP
jgi:hypothetical protein